MSDKDRTCSNCHHWQTDDPTHAICAPCALGNIARPEFWQGCKDFLDRERAAAEQMQQQSACRPNPWGPYLSGVKS